MTRKDLISLVEARLAYLQQLRASAAQLGDIQQIARIDAEMAETQETLTKLLTLE